MRAFVFPGQGTQCVGMGERLYSTHEPARLVFDAAAQVLGFDLAAACFRGDPDELTKTDLAQPAIFVTNAAALAVLESWGILPDLVAGHSVGEISALHAARALSFDEALRLVSRRAAIMATVRVHGAMSAVLGLDEHDVLAACSDARGVGSICIGLHNGPRNFVVSGAARAVETAERICRERGAIRVQRLRTQHAFHSPLMTEVVEPWRTFVRSVEFAEPVVPVALNSTGRCASGVDDIATAVVDQIANTVRWHDCVGALVAAGAGQIVESGDTKVLSALARATHPTVPTVTMADPRARRRLEDAVPHLTSRRSTVAVP